jgi:hypothetical protein
VFLFRERERESRVYLNFCLNSLDMQLWSKLSSDRVPHEKELLQMIDMNLNLESYKHS